MQKSKKFKIGALIFTSLNLFFAPAFPGEIYPKAVYKKHAALINEQIAIKNQSSIKLKGTCNSSKLCTIAIDGEGIFTTHGDQIKSDRIIGWTIANTTNSGGVLFLSRNEDYRFLIKYFDDLGNRNISEIGFYNFKSAQSFMNSLELLSGLSLNHDQAGMTTHCLAIGKDNFSGTDIDQISDVNKNYYERGIKRNTLIGSTAGAIAGAGVGDLVGEAASITTGTIAGGIIGGFVGNSFGKNSGNLSLKRNVVSEVRSQPANSTSFNDGSYKHRDACKDPVVLRSHHHHH